MARGSSTEDAKREFRLKWSRDWIIVALFVVAFAVILGRLAYVQVVKAGEYAQLADRSHMIELALPAKRGTIYDRNGEVLASSIEATTVYVDPREVTDPAALSTVLEKHLGKRYGMDYQDYYSRVTMADTSFAYIQRKADKKIASALKEELDAKELTGIHYLEDTRRVYPNELTGSQVVGAIDVDGIGIAGLEMRYDELVGGTDGTRQMERGGGDTPIAGGVIYEEPAVDGKDITTSIDIRLQQKAEERLKKVLKRFNAKGGSVTVMDASNGELYAACSYSKSKNEKGATTYSLDVGKIWSISDGYEPGSTFKTITAASIFDNSKVTADTVFHIPAKLDVYDAVITDMHDHYSRDLTFRRVIAESSNVGTVLAARKVENAGLYKTYKAFGFGDNPGTDFPGVTGGQLEGIQDWDGVQEANITFGQGLFTTGLQIVRAYGAIEQRGIMRVPHFLVDVPGDEQAAQDLTKDLKKTSKAAGKKVCNKVTSLLKTVVSSGTGEEASIEKFSVAGKTGTAEIVNSNGKYGDSTILSFCGWLEGSSSDLVCLVTVEKPNEGAESGEVCGGVFKEIMEFAIERYQIYPNAEEGN